jgi:hypothetical protein
MRPSRLGKRGERVVTIVRRDAINHHSLELMSALAGKLAAVITP